MKKLTILDLVAQVIYSHTYMNIMKFLDADEVEEIEKELREKLKDFRDE